MVMKVGDSELQNISVESFALKFHWLSSCTGPPTAGKRLLLSCISGSYKFSCILPGLQAALIKPFSKCLLGFGAEFTSWRGAVIYLVLPLGQLDVV